MISPRNTAALLAVALSPVAVFSATNPTADPEGDAIPVFMVDQPLIDAVEMSVAHTSDGVTCAYLTFVNSVEPASASAVNSLAGLLEFDVDQNGMTGVPPLQNGFSASGLPELKGFGGEKVIDLFGATGHPGMVPIFTADGLTFVGEAHIEFLGNRMTTWFETALVGAPPWSYTAVVGTIEQPTDAMDAAGCSMTVSACGAADINGDGVISFLDFQLMEAAFPSMIGDPEYDPAADLDADGAVSFFDYAELVAHLGCPGRVNETSDVPVPRAVFVDTSSVQPGDDPSDPTFDGSSPDELGSHVTLVITFEKENPEDMVRINGVSWALTLDELSTSIYQHPLATGLEKPPDNPTAAALPFTTHFPQVRDGVDRFIINDDFLGDEACVADFEFGAPQIGVDALSLTLQDPNFAGESGATINFTGLEGAGGLTQVGTLQVTLALSGRAAPETITGRILIGAPCPADLNGSGAVDGADLGLLLQAWDPVGPTSAAADLNGDGKVDGADLGLLLQGWGACP